MTKFATRNHCQHGYYSHICTTSVHTSVFTVSLSKWSLTFKIIPGVPPRIDLILLVLICRVTPIIIKLWVLIHNVHPTSHTYVSQELWKQIHDYTVYLIVLSTFRSVDVLYINVFGRSMFWYVDVLVWFGLSKFWSVDVSVCRRFGLLMFWYVDVLVCRRFSLSTFWSVDISVSQCFGLSTFWLSTFRFLDVLTSYLRKGPLWHTKSSL